MNLQVFEAFFLVCLFNLFQCHETLFLVNLRLKSSSWLSWMGKANKAFGQHTHLGSTLMNSSCFCSSPSRVETSLPILHYRSTASSQFFGLGASCVFTPGDLSPLLVLRTTSSFLPPATTKEADPRCPWCCQRWTSTVRTAALVQQLQKASWVTLILWHRCMIHQDWTLWVNVHFRIRKKKKQPSQLNHQLFQCGWSQVGIIWPKV